MLTVVASLTEVFTNPVVIFFGFLFVAVVLSVIIMSATSISRDKARKRLEQEAKSKPFCITAPNRKSFIDYIELSDGCCGLYIEYKDEVLFNKRDRPKNVLLDLFKLYMYRGWVNTRNTVSDICVDEKELIRHIYPILRRLGLQAGLKESNFIGDPTFGFTLNDEQIKEWGLDTAYSVSVSELSERMVQTGPIGSATFDSDEDFVRYDLFEEDDVDPVMDCEIVEVDQSSEVATEQDTDYSSLRESGMSHEEAMSWLLINYVYDCNSNDVRADELDAIQPKTFDIGVESVLAELRRFKLPEIPELPEFPQESEPRKWLRFKLNMTDWLNDYRITIDRQLHDIEEAIRNLASDPSLSLPVPASTHTPDTVEFRFWLDSDSLAKDVCFENIVDIIHVDKVFNFDEDIPDGFDFVELCRGIPTNAKRAGVTTCVLKYVKQDYPGRSPFTAEIYRISDSRFASVLRRWKNPFSVNRTRVVLIDENGIEWSLDYFNNNLVDKLNVLATAYVPRSKSHSFVTPEWVNKAIHSYCLHPYRYIDMDVASRRSTEDR